MTTIVDTIIEETNKFYTYFGINPSCVYLGENQKAALIQFIRDTDYRLHINLKDKYRPEVNGLLLYVVNAKDHLRVGL